jgi:hypothetical protein
MKNLEYIGFNKYSITQAGEVFSHNIHRNLKQKTNKYGYKTVILQENGYRKDFTVHRLVALAFIPNPDNRPCVNHIDGDKSNNCVSNLEWVTEKENAYHAVHILGKGIGETHGMANLTEKDVHEICKYMEDGYRNDELCEMFNLKRANISKIRNGLIWTHVSKDYKINVKRRNRLSKEVINYITLSLEAGKSVRYIIENFKPYRLSETTIRRIKNKNNF